MSELGEQPLSDKHPHLMFRPKEVTTFEQMHLRELLLRGIHAYGFTSPSTIQQQAIRPCLLGKCHDVIAQASSGEGKTAALIISILQRIDLNVTTCQAIILEPTRELVLATQRMIHDIGNLMAVTCYACVTGIPVQQHLDRFEAGIQIVVGTPGRTYDMFQRSKRCYDTVQVFGLDNVGHLLNMGFLDQIYGFWKLLPKKLQVLFFSDIVGPDILELTNRIMKHPLHMQSWREKLEYTFNKAPFRPDESSTLGDCDRNAQSLMDHFRQHNRAFTVVRSNMTGRDRTEAIEQIRTGLVRYLITTDVITPSKCLTGIQCVINYDIPLHMDRYLRRIGCSSRCSWRHIAISLVTDYEQQRIHEMEHVFHTVIQPMPANVDDLFYT